MGKRASIKPSQAEAGGDFGFPAGSTVEITEAAWSTWEEAGEKALVGGRSGDDPALKLVGEIEGQDDPRTVFLGAGKANRLTPSRDGEYLEIAEGSSANAISSSSNANIFLDSLCDKKTHGKLAMDEDKLDEDPISESLVGLKFVAGGRVVTRNFQDDGASKGGKRPTLVADEIIELPGGKKSSSKAKGRTAAKDGEEEEPRSKSKSKKSGGKSDDSETGTLAEKAVLKAFENPKYRKGIPAGKLYTAVYAQVKDTDEADDIMKLVSDEDWAQDEARPWVFDKDDEMYTNVD